MSFLLLTKNDQYRIFFSGCQPNPRHKIPMTPGQLIILKCLRLFRKSCVESNFADLAGARPSLSAVTRQAGKHWLFLKKNCHFNFVEIPNSWKLQPLWNLICSTKLSSDIELVEFVSQPSERSTVPGAAYQLQLKNGVLLSRQAKRINFIRDLTQNDNVQNEGQKF